MELYLSFMPWDFRVLSFYILLLFLLALEMIKLKLCLHFQLPLSLPLKREREVKLESRSGRFDWQKPFERWHGILIKLSLVWTKISLVETFSWPGLGKVYPARSTINRWIRDFVQRIHPSIVSYPTFSHPIRPALTSLGQGGWMWE